MNGRKDCKHKLVKQEEHLSGMTGIVYVCSKCGYRCEEAIAEKWLK